MRGSDEKKGRWRGCVCDGGGADDGENKEAESDENVELTVVNDEDGMKNVVGVVRASWYVWFTKNQGMAVK